MIHPSHTSSVHRLLARKKSKRTVDSLVYVIGVTGNIAVVPQIIKAWESSTPGMAVSTWFLFLVFGFIWLIYAIQHRQKPLIIAQVCGIACSLAVVSGWVFNNWIQ